MNEIDTARIKRAIRTLAQREGIHTQPEDWLEQAGWMYCLEIREWSDAAEETFIPGVDPHGRLFWTIAP